MQTVDGLSGSLALKGGTAIQGTVFGFKRLSIDVDLNYIGHIEKDKMKQDREEVRRKLTLLLRDMGYRIERPDIKYAEEQFDAHYLNCWGGQDRIKLEINYLERLPVCNVGLKAIKNPFIDLSDVKVMSYRPEELFAGKMRALIVRSTPRDVYDASLIAHHIPAMDEPLFRKVSLFYLSMHDDVRSANTRSIKEVSEADMENALVPMLSRNEPIDKMALRSDALALAEGLLDLSDTENEFFDTLYSKQRLEQDILFSDMPVSRGLDKHPAILWRMHRMNEDGIEPE
jgi:predicted nucleotidyltransferase component of viral defense system